MLDVMATLNPAHGLAGRWQVARPSPPDHPLWSIAVDIGGLGARDAGEEEYPLHLVGACGASRSDAMVRAAGEAVERYALMPRRAGGPRSRTGTTAPDTLDFAAESLGDPAAAGEPLTWYEGHWLGSGEPVWLPAGLVDYPVSTRWFDPTPSGAAAGGDLDFALRGALLETIERDAVAVAWAAEAGLTALDTDAELAAAPRTQPWRQIRTLWTSAREAGLTTSLAEVTTGLPGVHCVLAAAVDRTRGRTLAAVGVKAHPDWGRAILIALQEALQVRTALLGIADTIGDAQVPMVRDDVDRARLWMTEPAVAELERRLRDLPVRATRIRDVPAAPVTPESLVRGMIADGARPAAVELTGRLPEVHRAMGWRVVKVIAPGYQPLRMDEATSFGWRHDRIDAVRRRHGLTAGRHATFPHPLI
ncbi:YcaO-like family protein [Amycolatopsis sp. NPDC059021]|uniref:YcaO-like family protein n=1 Tax=Amycolatopsis sp. NPDC059021 TaxID=3346704 RepID=UPI00366D1A76